MIKQRASFSWFGSEHPYIDQVDILPLGHAVLGRFGGNSAAAQSKNEDGCQIWLEDKEDWEFAMVLDAHNSAQSAELVIRQVEKIEPLALLYYRVRLLLGCSGELKQPF